MVARVGARLCWVLACAGIALGAAPADAIPVVFEWEEAVPAVGGSNIPGVDPGDPIIIRVFADNGGANLLNQTWNNADVSMATLTAGAYSATYFPPTGFGDPVFETDAAGNVSTAREVFIAQNAGNFDSLGGASIPTHARNLASTSTAGSFLNWDSTDGDTFEEAQWTVSVVPEPDRSLLVAFALLVPLGAWWARSRGGSHGRGWGSP